MAPTALRYGAKRNDLPRSALDTVSSPSRTRRDTRSTPARLSNSPKEKTTGLDPEAVLKCRSIIKTMRTRPLCNKQAILPRTSRPPIRNKSDKAQHKKKQQVTKNAKPKKKATTKIKCFLNSSELLTTIRPETFSPSPNTLKTSWHGLSVTPLRTYRRYC